MSESEKGSNAWLKIYVRYHRHLRTRYAIDRYLLEAGCDPVALEAAWQAVLSEETSARLRYLYRPAGPSKFRRLLIILNLAVLLVTVLWSTFTGLDIEKAEAIWFIQSIPNYRIEIEAQGFPSHVHLVYFVKDGKLASKTCSGYWPVFEQTDYSVPGLFSEARRLLNPTESYFGLTLEQLRQSVEIEFDPTYGFPKRISRNLYKVAGYLDANSSLKVVSFEIVKRWDTAGIRLPTLPLNPFLETEFICTGRATGL